MAKVKGIADLFAQQASIDLVANIAAPPGVVSVQVPTTHSATDRIGIVIERIQYSFHEDWVMPANTEALTFGMSFIPAVVAWNLNGRTGVLDYNQIIGQEIGAPAAGLARESFFGKEKDFTNLTGGGILVHPSSLFFWAGAFNAYAWNGITINSTFWYKLVELSEDLYRELWELRLIAQGI